MALSGFSRELLPLVGITVSAFVFNTSEFMPISLLTDIGATFGTSEAQTGLLVSIYAWAVMILSLPLMVLATRVDFRRLLLLVILVFAVGQVLSAVAVSYGMLMAARLVVAAAHSVFWAIVAPIAVRVASPDKQALALSFVVMGSSVAMIAGLPLGRAIGILMGWRLTFTVVGVIAFALLAYLTVVLPKVPGAEPFSLRQLPSLFRNKALTGIFVLTAIYAMGNYTLYSYIELFMAQINGLSADAITLALSAFGAAVVVGSLMYAKLPPVVRFPFTCLVVFGVGAATLLFRFAGTSVVAVFALCALWGISGTSYSVALQAEVIRNAASEEQTVAMSIFSGIFNFGIGFGALLGGGVVDSMGIGNVGFVAGGIGMAATLYAIFVLVPRLKRRTAELSAASSEDVSAQA